MTLSTPQYLPLFFFFFNDTATTEIYTLSLHDALPICLVRSHRCCTKRWSGRSRHERSEEHTSELQSRLHLVCRLLLEKKSVHTRLHLYTNNTLSQCLFYDISRRH